jgi:hypothetical protein
MEIIAIVGEKFGSTMQRRCKENYKKIYQSKKEGKI